MAALLAQRTTQPTRRRAEVRRMPLPDEAGDELPTDETGFTVLTSQRRGVLVVEIHGPLDIYTVPEFWSALARARFRNRDVIVDLGDVGLVDSTGLGSLSSLSARARGAGRGVGILNCDPILRRIFEIARLQTAFVFGTRFDQVRAELCQRADEHGIGENQ